MDGEPKMAASLERLRWRLIWWPLDMNELFLEDVRSDRPNVGTAWFADVVRSRRVVGTVGLWFLVDGTVRTVPLLAGDALDRDGETEEAAALYEFIDDATAIVVGLDRGMNPDTLLRMLGELRALGRTDLRQALAERHGWSCYLCARPIPHRFRNRAVYEPASPDPLFPDIEHVVPVRHGGPHWWGNLRLAHRACNNSKTDTDPTLRPDFMVALKRWTGPDFQDLSREDRDTFFSNYVKGYVLSGPPIEKATVEGTAGSGLE